MQTVAMQEDHWERSAYTDASNPTRALHSDWISVIMSDQEDGIKLSLIHDIARSRAMLSSVGLSS